MLLFTGTTEAAPIPVTSYTVNSSGVTFVMSPGSMRIDVCSDRIIRVRYSSQGTIPVDNNMNFLVTRTWTPPAFTHAETTADVTITTANIRVRVTKATGALTFLDLGGTAILQETANGGKSLTPYIEQSFDSPSDEAIYGLGSMHDGIINYRGMPQYFYQANTHIAMPMILSNKGYGVLWANASRTYFNLPGQQITGGQFTTTTAGDYVFLGVDGSHQSTITITVDGRTLNTLNNTWHSGSLSGKINLGASRTVSATLSSGTLYGGLMQNSTKFSSRGGQIVDYYFFYGPNPDDVIAGFRTATGAAPLFSKGTYGFVQCRERYSSQAEILDNAHQFRTRTIPVDIIVQDWNYWGSYGWGAMQFDPAAYPNPTTMIDSLHRMHYKYMISVWSNPQGSSNQVRNALNAQNQIIPGTNFFDAYNPTGRSIYWQYMNNAFFAIGTDAFWEDANEPENTNLESTTVNFGSGAVSGRTYANAYGLHVCKAVADGWRSVSSAKRVCILTRSGFPGSQRFGTIYWNGDIGGNWDWFQRSIPAGLNFCMAGIPYWTTDIGGFFRPSNQYTDAGYNELLTRWIEYGAFCPIFRIHGYTSQTEIWRYTAATQAAFRMYDDLRYRLLPYYYSLARMVTNSGYTIMRGLAMDFRTDANVNNITNQFMTGPAFLVNPVTTAGATTRSVYLPSGSTWYNFWNGQTSAGGQTVSARAHRDTIPVFVRSGSIVPMGPYLQYAAQKQADTIELRVYPGASGSLTLYEDQSENYNYESGAYATIPITYDGSCVRIGARSGSFTGMLTSRRFNVVFVRSNHGVGVPWTTVASPDTSVLYSGSLVECGTCGTGVIGDAAPASSLMPLGMSFKIAKDRITFHEAFAGKIKSVAVYNLGGKRLAIKTVSKNVVSLRGDFGVPDGVYIIKVKMVP
ncbi:MAG: glycoside hydrolase family 31 protein [Chitinispirillaceae bacterium]|nr:glycoside hydrolase family 31 protein [Chitinispirillaceae bacterium]